MVMKPTSRSFQAICLAAAVAMLAAVTLVCRLWLPVTNATTIALTYLLIVLITAAASALWVAVVVSVVADLLLNYFFMPPFGTLTIDDPQNWVALLAFLTVSLIASNLSAKARDQAREATARRDELARLFGLSRDVLLTSDSHQALSALAEFVARRFTLAFVAIALPRAGGWELFQAGPQRPASDPVLAAAISDAAADGPRIVAVGDRRIKVVSLRAGDKNVGLVAVDRDAIEPATLDALAGVLAIAIERAEFLDERQAAEMARQREELKSTLLASLGHDLRTPLTAIRVAASNLQGSWLTEVDRREQGDLVLAEVERLSRVFQNILEMARLDAGAVSPDARWVHPSEIFEAARDHVQHSVRERQIDLVSDSDTVVHLDPRLTALALAYLLENAAQYTPPTSPIAVRAEVTSDGLVITVRDHGAGIRAADLPHLFERFYRGADAKRRVPGIGMGLAIVHGIVSAERGRVWAENCADGGAQFTMIIPAEHRTAAAATAS